MPDDSTGKDAKKVKVNSDNEYFTYSMSPRNIGLDFYLKVYEKFCEAYGMSVEKDDIQNFSYLINKRIISRHNPEGVDYKPRYGGSARLYIMPQSHCVRFRSYPINSVLDNEHFVKLANNYFKKPKNSGRETLENRL